MSEMGWGWDGEKNGRVCERAIVGGLLLTDIRLEEVGAHAGDVTNIVTHVVGNDTGVAGVIFRNPCFDLTDEIRADISGFGVNPTAHTREECNG